MVALALAPSTTAGYDPEARTERVVRLKTRGDRREVTDVSLQLASGKMFEWMCQYYGPRPAQGGFPARAATVATVNADVGGCSEACAYCMSPADLKYGPVGNPKRLMTPDELFAKMAIKAENVRVPANFDPDTLAWTGPATTETQRIAPERVAFRITAGEPLLTPDWTFAWGRTVLGAGFPLVIDTHMRALANPFVADAFRAMVGDRGPRVRLTGHVLGLTAGVLRMTTRAAGASLRSNLDGLAAANRIARETGMDLRILYDCYMPRPEAGMFPDVPEAAEWSDDATRPQTLRRALGAFFDALVARGVDPASVELRPIRLWRDARLALTRQHGIPSSWTTMTDPALRKVLADDFVAYVQTWTQVCAERGITYQLPFPYPFRSGRPAGA